MRNFLLAAASIAALSTPAVARDGQPYVGIEGGLMMAKDQNVDITLDGTDEGFSDGTYENAIGVDYKTGIDLDLIAGYDFGMFRLEGELGWKRAGLDHLDISDEFIDAVDADVGLADAFEDVDLDGHATVLSGMVNGLLDFGNDDGTYANDDECDDPRFEGTGMGVQLDDHLMADATDCSTAYQAGTVTLVSERSGDSGDFRINFGDDSASSAFDGVCDDPRFQGRGGAMELLDSNMLADASDCRSAYEAGTVTYDPRT